MDDITDGVGQSEQDVLVTMGLAPGVVSGIGGVIPKGGAAPSGTVPPLRFVIRECPGKDIAEK